MIKPRIYKVSDDRWVCCSGYQSKKTWCFAYGVSPALAYEEWRQNMFMRNLLGADKPPYLRALP